MRYLTCIYFLVSEKVLWIQANNKGFSERISFITIIIIIIIIVVAIIIIIIVIIIIIIIIDSSSKCWFDTIT